MYSKYLIKSNVSAASEVQKLYSAIVEKRSQNFKDDNIKELEQLKEKCLNKNNIQECLLASHAFIKLVENGVLNGTTVIAMFMSILGGSNRNQLITDGLIELLMLDLKQKTTALKKGEKYLCPYGLKPPQHPMIIIFRGSDGNINDLIIKISGICGHHDKQITKNCIEFLRPFYLYIFCNETVFSDTKSLWTILLNQILKLDDALNLVLEIFSWMRFDTATICLQNSIHIMDTIEQLLLLSNREELIAKLIIYLASIIENLCSFCNDPRPAFNLILKVIYSKNSYVSDTENVLLMLLSKTFHIISPIYFADLLRVISVIVISHQKGNVIALHMIADGIIQWIAQPFFMTSTYIEEFKSLIEFITTGKYKILRQSTIKAIDQYHKSTSYFNADIALANDLCRLCEQSDDSIVKFIDHLKNSHFAMKINLPIRALFLSNDLKSKNWIALYEILLGLLKIDNNLGTVILMPVLYKLANETDPEPHLIILKSLSAFGVVKENIPIILNTLEALTQKHLTSICLKLYLELWKIEPRTYSFFNKILMKSITNKNSMSVYYNDWEYQIVKANTIREVCSLRPSQYGTDMVILLSEILNTQTGEDGDISTSIAVDAIRILCENHVINAVSTWTVLCGKFKNETRPRTIKSLCKFFGVIPALKVDTIDYDNLVNEFIDILWNYIINFNDPQINIFAFNALKRYNHESMGLHQFPETFRQQTIKQEARNTGNDTTELNKVAVVDQYIPGDCWIEVVQNINYEAASGVVDLLSHYIYHEIENFRGGVYVVPEGRPEPLNFKSLPAKSVLRAVTHHLIKISKSQSHEDDFCLENCLNILSKDFPKPIPPLNWTFLHEFMHRGNHIRRSCINIAVNQCLYSGTAKRLIENVLIEFRPTPDNLEDIQQIYDLMPKLFDGISHEIFKNFMIICFEFAFNNRRKDQGPDCPLIQIFLAIKTALNLKPVSPEKHSICFELITKYFEKMSISDPHINAAIQTICSFPVHTVEDYTSLFKDWESSELSVKRNILIRCHLIENNNTFANQLQWLNPIIDLYTLSNATEEYDKNFLLSSVVQLLSNFKNNKNACDWILDILGKIQRLICDNNSSANVTTNCEFLCDVFILAVVVLSGYSCFYGDSRNLVQAKQERERLFPESLNLLCEQDYWANNEQKVIESLYHLYLSPSITQNQSEIFKTAIIYSKNHAYFHQKDIWMKYVCMKK